MLCCAGLLLEVSPGQGVAAYQPAEAPEDAALRGKLIFLMSGSVALAISPVFQIPNMHATLCAPCHANALWHQYRVKALIRPKFVL